MTVLRNRVLFLAQSLGGALAGALIALTAMISAPQAFDDVPNLADTTNWIEVAQGNSANQDKDKSKKKSKDAKSSPDDSDTDGGVDRATRDAVAAFFMKNPGKTHALPPGIAKNLARGKPLPPGIAKRNLPAELDTELSDLGSDVGDILEGVIVGDDVVVIDKATDVIVDILKGVVTGAIVDQ